MNPSGGDIVILPPTQNVIFCGACTQKSDSKYGVKATNETENNEWRDKTYF